MHDVMVKLDDLSTKDAAGSLDEHNLPHHERVPSLGDTEYVWPSNPADEYECESSTLVGHEEAMESRRSGRVVPYSSKSEENHLPPSEIFLLQTW